METTDTSKATLWRYRVFRKLPGAFGQRYFEKYASLTAARSFDAAVRNSAGMICIDLGANIGEYSEKLATTAGRVISFEPDPWTFKALVERVGKLDNVEAVNAAAGTKDGHIMLYRHGDFDSDPVRKSQSSSVCLSKGDVTAEAAISVEQIDFLRFLRELDEDIGVLKIDIEGAEVDLLETLFDEPELFRRVHYVFAETHERLIPDHKDRVRQLHIKAKRTRRPKVNLFWH